MASTSLKAYITANGRTKTSIRKDGTLAYMQGWGLQRSKIVQTSIRAARQSLEEASPVTLKDIIQFLQVVRSADTRDPLTPSQISSIPNSGHLLTTLVDLALNPLTFEPLNYPHELISCIANPDDPYLVLNGGTDLAQSYLRFERFSDHLDLVEHLEKIRIQKAHYGYLIDTVIAYSVSLPAGLRILGYGGYTVANVPRGREEDDADAPSSSLWTALAELRNKPSEVYEVRSLRFPVEGTIPARADHRTSLYEELLIDSFGFISGNVAPGGQTIRIAVSEEQNAMSNRIASIAPEEGLFSRMKALKLEPATEETTEGKGKSKGKEKREAEQTLLPVKPAKKKRGNKSG